MLHDYSQVLRRFVNLKPQRRAQTWSAACPAHGDQHNSLYLYVGRTGALQARCLANKGCTFAGIVAASKTDIKDWFPPKDQPVRRTMQGKIVATYPYHNEKGQLAYEALRIEPGDNGARKKFSFRRPPREGEAASHGWVWNLEGVEKIPYRLPEILDPKRKHHPVFVAEGEGCVETLRRLGFLATCNPCGAGKWLPLFGRVLRGRRCVILPDNDRDGRLHAMQVFGSLGYWHAASIRIVHLPVPEKGDVTDFVEECLERHSLEQCKKFLIAQIQKSPEYKVPVPA